MASPSKPLHKLTASEARSLILSDSLTLEAYVSALNAHIKARDADVKAWAYFDPEYALQQARNLDKVPKNERKPLFGFVVGVKDVIYTNDMPTQHNSPIYASNTPTGVDASSIIIFRSQHALILGKTTTTEFAATTDGPVTRNPNALPEIRTPGGSSSGSGAAVADCQVPIALGTQTGGSVIRPGSFNGIYAFKPTWNAISREGQKIYSVLLDTLGFYARSVEDLQTLGAVFRLEDDNPPPTSFSLAGAKFAFMKTEAWDQKGVAAGQGTRDAFEAAKSILKDKGAEVVDVELPSDFANLGESCATLLDTEGRAAFLDTYLLAKDQLNSLMVGHVDNVGKYTRAQQLAAQDRFASLRPKFDEIARQYTAIITPSVPDVAPKGIESTGSAAFCRMWTALHVPVLNVPGFQGENGMPIGLSLVAPRYWDQHLLVVAKEVGREFKQHGGCKTKLE